jgi:RNA polymerase sigma-70 factor (ECF subfamily)
VASAEEIFRQHGVRIRSLARGMLGNEADVEDVVQEVLLQVVRKLDTFRGQAQLTTWLHRITVNCALGHHRKNAPRRACEVSSPSELLLEWGRQPAGTRSLGGRPDRQVLDRELRRQIDRAIAQLPEIYRDPFMLSDVEGLADAEVGELLGLSVAAVKSRLHRARLLLREALSPYFPERAAV